MEEKNRFPFDHSRLMHNAEQPFIRYCPVMGCKSVIGPQDGICAKCEKTHGRLAASEALLWTKAYESYQNVKAGFKILAAE